MGRVPKIQKTVLFISINPQWSYHFIIANWSHGFHCNPAAFWSYHFRIFESFNFCVIIARS